MVTNRPGTPLKILDNRGEIRNKHEYAKRSRISTGSITAKTKKAYLVILTRKIGFEAPKRTLSATLP